jgi:ribosomal protein S12 methylthiotransferase
MFDAAGYKATFDKDGFSGGSVIINTCGFIGDAKEESINMILEAVNAKESGAIDSVFVMGCLAERYKSELPTELPEVDGWYGKFDWIKIINDLEVKVPEMPSWERILSTPSHYAYVKIAEGCNRFCSFCAIPLITGRYQSRPVEEILDEVKSLVARGVSEFNILAQDLSYYGRDIYNHSALAELIDRMAQIDGVHRIRLHYAYPADFPYDLLPVMAKHKNVCKYLDIALQHVSDVVLENMRRHIDGAETRALLKRIREEVPGIHIRTTLMVGFPGEGEAEFEELKQFVKEQRFERMGAFAYCEEEDTYGAENFEDNIPEDVKQRRLDEIMAIQEEIALESNKSKVGKTLEVVIDSENEDYYVGRTEYDSPEVDPEVLIEKTQPMQIGQYYNVKITSADTFELLAVPVINE